MGELHMLRCAKIQITEIVEDTTEKVKKKKKKAKDKFPDGDEEDFDLLCEGFQNMNKVCNYPKCKTLITTLGVDCPFCRVRFCLHHSMAEVHGCGPQAKQAARQQVQRQGKITPGSGSVTQSQSSQAKRAQLARKLEKKVGE